MLNDPTDNNPQTSRQKHGLAGITNRYRATSFAYFVQTIEPLGVLFVVIGIVVSAIALSLSWSEIRKERAVQEATLLALVSERLDAAREQEKNGELGHAGQIPVLERMVDLKISLRGINASEVNLSGAKFPEANFWCASLFGTDFSSSNLTKANLEQAQLVGADFSDANLTGSSLDRAWVFSSKFPGANLKDVSLRNTLFSNVDLSKAKGLTENQLSEACIYSGGTLKLPEGMSGDKIKTCRENQATLLCPRFGHDRESTKRKLLLKKAEQ